MYNGWRNWETWNCGLYYGDLVADMAAEADSVDEVTDVLESLVREQLDTVPDGFAYDLMLASIDCIDFAEIAEAYWGDRYDLDGE